MNHKRSISLDKRSMKSPKQLPSLSPVHRVTPSLLLNDLLPGWLLNRSDFQRSLQEKAQIQNYNLRKLSPSPPLYSKIEKKVLNHHLSHFPILSGISKSLRKKFVKISEFCMFVKGQTSEIARVFFIISGLCLVDNELKIGSYNVIGDNLKLGLKEFLCVEDMTAVCINLSNFNDLLMYHSMKLLNVIRNQVSMIPVVSGFSCSRLSQFCQCIVPIVFTEKKCVFSIGEPSKYVYVIVSGEIEISSLVTFKTFNSLPTGKKIRETLITEKNYTHVLEIAKNSQFFGHKEAYENSPRCSKAIVISNKSKVYAFKWETAQQIFTQSEKEIIFQSIGPKQLKEVTQKIQQKLKNHKIRLKALLEASEIKKQPRGRELFEELTKRKLLYASAIESSHNKDLKETLIGCKYISSFL